MADIKRVAKDQDSGGRGVGDSFILPRDSMPEGLTTGEAVIIRMEGVIVGIDEQELVVKLDKAIEWNKKTNTDPLQSAIEVELNINM